MRSKRNVLIGALLVVVVAIGALALVVHRDRGPSRPAALVDCGHLVDRDVVTQASAPNGDAERCFALHATNGCDAALEVERYGIDTSDVHHLRQERYGNRCEVVDLEQSSVITRHYTHTDHCTSVTLGNHGLRVDGCGDHRSVVVEPARASA